MPLCSLPRLLRCARVAIPDAEVWLWLRSIRSLLNTIACSSGSVGSLIMVMVAGAMFKSTDVSVAIAIATLYVLI